MDLSRPRQLEPPRSRSVSIPTRRSPFHTGWSAALKVMTNIRCSNFRVQRILQFLKSIAGCYAAHAFTFTSLPLAVPGSTWSSVSLPVSRQMQFAAGVSLRCGNSGRHAYLAEHNKEPETFHLCATFSLYLIINWLYFFDSGKSQIT